MTVRVLFFGVLKDLTGMDHDSATLPAGSTIENLFAYYAQRFETLRAARSSILFARNQEFATADLELHDSDEVAFLPPVSGGSNPMPANEHRMEIRHPDGHIFALMRETINSRELQDQLQRPEDGAVVVFEGVVRNNTKGRATKFLEYHCYEPLAIKQMERIGLELRQAHAIGRIGIVHRLGKLEIGEASVSIVATAPHRRAAFEAALNGINRLKREVPIWKKEYFEDGAVWVEGEWDDNLPGRAVAKP